MSSKEYSKVTETLGILLRYAAEHHAIEIGAAIENRDKEQPQTEKWWYFNLLATASFEEFTEIVETIYPGNVRKMQQWTQTLDEETDQHTYRDKV